MFVTSSMQAQHLQDFQSKFCSAYELFLPNTFCIVKIVSRLCIIQADEFVSGTRFGDFGVKQWDAFFVIFGPQNSTKKTLPPQYWVVFPQKSCPNNGLNKGTGRDPKWTAKSALIPEALASRYVSGARPIV